MHSRKQHGNEVRRLGTVIEHTETCNISELFAVDGGALEPWRDRPDDPPHNRCSVAVGSVGGEGEPILVFNGGRYSIIAMPKDRRAIKDQIVGQVFESWHEPLGAAELKGSGQC